jgi:hypothetical protein
VLDRESGKSQVQIVENPFQEQPPSLEYSARFLAERQQVSRQSGDVGALLSPKSIMTFSAGRINSIPDLLLAITCPL